MTGTSLNDLIVTLEEAGVPILTRDGDGRVLEPAAFIEQVVENRQPARVRAALVPFFLARPDLGPTVRSLVRRLSEGAARKLKIYYTAAVYSQSRWKTRLEYSLGPQEKLEDLFSGELGLPPPNEYHGVIGLRELADLAQRELGGFNFLSEFEETALLFMAVREQEIRSRGAAG